ncbi:hypothetical protein RHMOL_Rhmol05G0303700 [Rhododendron molle]|uniref:Uncharacterized protein n=1 Tax=Rhododendron molle TaxID=49168 RepID=A0ACC0NVX4_RHOML|nr:hypothetical protein RHMOL_Rhmol05G0303700 [Rhododendron molle]
MLKESDAWPAEPQDAYGLEKLVTEELFQFWRHRWKRKGPSLKLKLTRMDLSVLPIASRFPMNSDLALFCSAVLVRLFSVLFCCSVVCLIMALFCSVAAVIPWL